MRINALILALVALLSLVLPASAEQLKGAVRTTDTPSTGALLYYNGRWRCRAAGAEGKVLKIVGGVPDWATESGGGGTPGGNNTHVQFNDSGAFGGSSNFVWDNSGKLLTLSDSGDSTVFKLTGANGAEIYNTFLSVGGSNMYALMDFKGVGTGGTGFRAYDGSTEYAHFLTRGATKVLEFTALDSSGALEFRTGPSEALRFKINNEGDISHLYDISNVAGNLKSSWSGGQFIYSLQDGNNFTGPFGIVAASEAWPCAFNGMVRARGSLGSPSAVQNGDNIGAFVFGGYDGSTVATQTAGFTARVDGTVGTNNVPTSLDIVTGNGSTGAIRMLFNSDGRVTIPNATSSVVPFTIQGASSQIEKLTNWKNNGGTVVASVAADGAVTTPTVTMTSTSHFKPAGGTTGQRPGSPTEGDQRYNTTDHKMEYWNGSIWVQY